MEMYKNNFFYFANKQIWYVAFPPTQLLHMSKWVRYELIIRWELEEHLQKGLCSAVFASIGG